jgi:hypothetical protein
MRWLIRVCEMSKRVRLGAPFFDPGVEPEAEPGSDVEQLTAMFRGTTMPPELKMMVRDATFRTWKHNGVQYLPRDGGWWIAPGQAIGAGAFVGCNTNITFGRNTTIHPSAFHQHQFHPGWVASGVTGVKFHVSHTDVPPDMFHGCTSLATVEGEGILRVGDEAFRGTGLELARLPHAETIGRGAFSYCAKLASAYIPVATTIEPEAFMGCTTLADIDLGAVTSLGESAFAESGIVNVRIPLLTTVESLVFYGCTQLVSAHVAAATVGSWAFADCEHLVDVDMPAVTVVGTSAFYGCRSLASVALPMATELDEESFADCRLLVSASMPSATKVGSHAFWYCLHLTNVDLPVATEIGPSAFASCRKLVSVDLPAAVTIGEHAFWDCARPAVAY